MKKLTLFLLLALASCSKESTQPESYYPNKRDTKKSVIDHLGITKEVNKFSKAFNDDGDYTYREHATVVRIISARVDKVSKIKD